MKLIFCIQVLWEIEPGRADLGQVKIGVKDVDKEERVITHTL